MEFVSAVGAQPDGLFGTWGRACPGQETDLAAPKLCLFRPTHASFTDEPDFTKLVFVPACEGKTGIQEQVAYTNSKVVGNGSFGVVFQVRPRSPSRLRRALVAARKTRS